MRSYHRTTTRAIAGIALGLTMTASGACGSGSSAPASTDGGANSGLPGMDGGGIPVPADLAGRWWGRFSFGSMFASAKSPMLTAFDVSPAPSGPNVPAHEPWLARLWFQGLPLSLDLFATDAGAGTYAVGVLDTHFVPPTACPGISGPLTLVVNGDTMTWQMDATACGGSPAQVVGTLYRSKARRIRPMIQTATQAAMSADGHLLAFGDGNHPWLWDASQSVLDDLAPATVDAGVNVPTGPGTPTASGNLRVFLSPDGRRAVYCIDGNAVTSLASYDIANGRVQILGTSVTCIPQRVFFSADGSHVAFIDGLVGASGVNLREWDSATGTVATAYGGVQTGDGRTLWYWPGKSGRYLLYYASPPSALDTGGDLYEPLYVYDGQTQQSQLLGQARWATPSPDGRFLAFSRSDGKLVVWDESAGSASPVDTIADIQSSTARSIGSYVTSTSTVIGLPLGTSPDGSKLLYLDGSTALRVLTLGTATPQTIGATVACTAGAKPFGVGAALFSDDSSKVGFVAPVPGSCASGTPSYAANMFDLSTGTDHAVPLPPSVTALEEVGAVGRSGAIEYDYLDTASTIAIQVWSPAAGDVAVQSKVSLLNDPLLSLSDDGNRLFFREPNAASTGAWADEIWDRTASLSMLANDQYNFAPPGFQPMLDAASGIAFAYDATARNFVIARPGASLAPSVKPDEMATVVLSPSRRTVAVSGTLGPSQGVFTMSFASGAVETFVEGGQAVAVSDSAVYFAAADGLCVSGP